MKTCDKCQKEVEPVQQQSGPHLGEYCPDCGKWFGWVTQDKPYDPNYVLTWGKHQGKKISELPTDYLIFMLEGVDDDGHALVTGCMKNWFRKSLNVRYGNFIKEIGKITLAEVQHNRMMNVEAVAAEFHKRWPTVTRERFDDYIVGIIAATYRGELDVSIYITNGCISFNNLDHLK